MAKHKDATLFEYEKAAIFVYDGKTDQEIAEKMHIPAYTVKAYKQRYIWRGYSNFLYSLHIRLLKDGILSNNAKHVCDFLKYYIGDTYNSIKYFYDNIYEKNNRIYFLDDIDLKKFNALKSINTIVDGKRILEFTHFDYDLLKNIFNKYEGEDLHIKSSNNIEYKSDSIRRKRELSEDFDKRLYSMSQIKDILELIKNKHLPNNEFGDDECNLFEVIVNSLNIDTNNFK